MDVACIFHAILKLQAGCMLHAAFTMHAIACRLPEVHGSGIWSACDLDAFSRICMYLRASLDAIA